MKKDELYQLYKDSFNRDLSSEELKQLQKLAEDYPYFSLPRVLLCKHENGLEDAEKNISFVSQRKLFRDFLQSKLYFAEIEMDPYMEEHPGRKSFRVLFPPHPFDHFTILDGLGKPSSAFDPSSSLYIDRKKKGRYHIAFLQDSIEEKVTKYKFLITSIKQELAEGLEKEVWKYKKTVEADDLVNQFLEQLPQIAPVLPVNIHEEQEEHEAATKSVQNQGDEFVTETLAKLHLKQNNKEEAIRIYELLRLRFPEKSAYFEAQLNKLKQ